MKEKKLRRIVIMILYFSMIGIKAQNTLNVHERLGAKTSFTVTNIQKLFITDGNLTIKKKDATTSTFLLTNLAHIDFSSISTGIVENKIYNQLLIFPNPVQDVLNVTILDAHTSKIHKLDIFGIDGKILISEILNKNMICVPVSSLSKGIYFYRIQDGNNITTNKFIKL